jgi:hypothetical protein
MKELVEVSASVPMLNDLNSLRVLHVAFEFRGKLIIASANFRFLILCMKENSLVRVINFWFLVQRNQFVLLHFFCPAFLSKFIRRN